MYILNPSYQSCRANFLLRLFGYKFQVIFRYAVEIESPTCRGVQVCIKGRGFFKTEEAANKRVKELYKNPEWSK